MLYDALHQWDKQGTLEVTDISQPFFQDLVGNATTGSFAKSSAGYTSLTSAVKTYADGFVAVVQEYTPSGGNLAEQFSRDGGEPASASDLTWSYAAFLTAVSRRNGNVPPSWGADGASGSLPDTCSGETVTGEYAEPSVGGW